MQTPRDNNMGGSNTNPSQRDADMNESNRSRGMDDDMEMDEETSADMDEEDVPDLDEEDLEENDLTDEEADDIEWDEPPAEGTRQS